MRFAQLVSRFTVCLLSRNYGTQSRLYCTFLQPQRKMSINCYNILTSDEGNLLFNNFDIANKFQIAEFLLDSPDDEVLSLVGEVTLTDFRIVTLLKALKIQVQEKHMSDDYLVKNIKFNRLCQTIQKSCYKFSPKCLVLSLKYLLIIGVSSQSTCIETIEHTILERIHEFDIESVVECLSFYHCYASTDLQKNVVKALTDKIQRSLNKIDFSSALFKLIQCYQCFDFAFLKELNLKLAQLVYVQEPQNLCNILCLLATKQKRNKIVLQALSTCFQRGARKPDLKCTVDIMYALKRLNFADVNLLSYLTEDRADEIAFITDGSVISRLLTVCGHLRWRNTALLEACGEWILNNISVCISREFVAYTLTAAALNYFPENKRVFQEIILRLKQEAIGSSSVWLDVIWSLAILEHVDKNELQKILTKDFFKLLIDGQDFNASINRLKLLNLKAVMKNEHPECIFSCDVFLDSLEVPKSYRIRNYKKSVIDALSNFIPTEKYLNVNIMTDFGFHVDAEFIMDVHGKPLSLLTYGSKLKISTVYQPLPNGGKRYALLLWSFQDFTLNEQTLTGPNSLAVRLLENQDYIVVQVPYEEFSSNTTAVKKAHYLQDRIASATKSRI